MSKHFSLPAVCTASCAGIMLGLFWVQATLQFHPHQPPSFAFTQQIAYGYASSAAPVCGNGIKTSLEGCDDGNTTSGDGCSATCTVESGYSCVGTTPSVCTTTCGDGVKAGSEQCDDANTTSGDGCSASCTIESGYSCVGTTPSTCSTICGDGLKKGSEGCDDGNTTAGDGCSASCTVESGYSCAGTAPSVCQTGCGDGVVAGTEQCDPGAAGESLTCNNDCTNAVCGDGKVNKTAGEECDSGAANGADKACTAQCKKTYCGDGVVQAPNGNGQTEACEPSLDSTCSNSCTFVTGLGVSTYTPIPENSSTATRLAPPINCGNGVLEPSKGEECDDGRFNGLSAHCDRWCHTQYCGDGIVQKQNGEECEPQRNPDGSYVTQPTCGQICVIPSCDANGFCKGGCEWKFQPACKASSSSESTVIAQQSSSFMDVQTAISDGIVQTTGPLTGAESSSAVSRTILMIRPVYASSSSAPFEYASSTSAVSSASTAVCGDGIVEYPETCDDGPLNSSTKPDACRLNCQKASCGDGVQDAGEECDRGAADNLLGNGCTPTCKLSLCGNGILEPGEECDEGKRNSVSKPDSCSTLCLLPRCGDGITDPFFGEVCDNGPNNSNTKPGACRLNCVPAHCGDGVKDPGEQCDDGPKGSATCSVSCMRLDTLQSVHRAPPFEQPIADGLAPSLLFLFILLLLFVYRLQRAMRI